MWEKVTAPSVVRQVALLPVPAQQEIDLCLEGVALPVAVEVGQEGILLEGLQEKLGREDRLEQPGESGLADTDDTFDGQIHAASWSPPPARWTGAWRGGDCRAGGVGVWAIG